MFSPAVGCYMLADSTHVRLSIPSTSVVRRNTVQERNPQKSDQRVSTAGLTVHFTTMSSPSEKSAENVKDNAEAVVNTLDSEGNRSVIVQDSPKLQLSRKAQLSAYFTIAAAGFGLIR